MSAENASYWLSTYRSLGGVRAAKLLHGHELPEETGELVAEDVPEELHHDLLLLLLRELHKAGAVLHGAEVHMEPRHLPLEARPAPLHERIQQRLFASVVLIERRRAAPHGGGDLRHAHRVVTLLGKEPQRLHQKLIPGIIRSHPHNIIPSFALPKQLITINPSIVNFC